MSFHFYLKVTYNLAKCIDTKVDYPNSLITDFIGLPVGRCSVALLLLRMLTPGRPAP